MFAKFLSVKERFLKGILRLSKGPLGLEEGEGEGRGWIMDVRDGSREPWCHLWGRLELLKFWKQLIGVELAFQKLFQSYRWWAGGRKDTWSIREARDRFWVQFIKHPLDQSQQKFCVKGQSKYIKLCGPCGLFITLPLCAAVWKQPLAIYKQMGMAVFQENFIYKNRHKARFGIRVTLC